MTQLSEHFSLEEVVTSQEAARRGIDNTPSPEIIERLKETCQQAEAVRALLNAPMLISSGYRSPELNAAIGGVPDSAHVAGYAIDFICPMVGTPLEVCKKIQGVGVRCDQLINEGAHGTSLGWVHISFAPTYRQQYLTANFGTNETTYKEGLEVA